MEPLQMSEDKPSVKVPKRVQEVNMVREIFARITRYWYWFVLSVIFCIGVARVYLRYSIPVYNIESRFLIKKQNPATSSQQEVISQLNGGDNSEDVQNEIEIIQTKFLMKRVVHDLQLNVGIYAKGRIRGATEMYKNAPFRIHLLYISDSAIGVSWKVSLNAQSMEPVLTESSGATIQAHWGDTIRVKDIAFTVENNGAKFPVDGEYILSIAPEDALALSFLSRIKVAPVADGMNIIRMSVADPLPERGADILNDLYEVYVKANIEDQSTLADNTITFIDNRLTLVSQELSGVEKNIEQFKTSNNLTDLGLQSSIVTNNENDLQKQMVQQDVQLEILDAIESQLNAKDFRVVPTSLQTQSPGYTSLVDKFNSLVLERDGQLETSKENNPLILQLNDRIEGVRKDLRTALENVRKEMLINKANLSSRMDAAMGMIKGIPSKQRTFLDISRQQEVKQQLYIFLLQKREETAISKSGTLSNSRLIDPARADLVPFSPNRSSIYLTGLIIGLLLPAGFIYLSELLNNKIRERRDITMQTDAPILGEIGHNKSGDLLVATSEARTIIAEQFRAIRTNLRFLLTGKQHQVILITSSMSGEGKSFISLNLANSLAISGKKVVLLELDLRKPRLSGQLGLENEQGFTNYIISNADLKYLPKPVMNQPNLFVINSGPIPPNPAELLLQDKVKLLFEYLYANYDYIVIDTPPVGLVSDALLVSHYADTCLYVTRQNYTFKQQISIIDDLFTGQKMKGLSVLINDVDSGRHQGYGYGYGYGYGDGSYYTNDQVKRSFWRALFSKKR